MKICAMVTGQILVSSVEMRWRVLNTMVSTMVQYNGFGLDVSDFGHP